MPAPLLPTCASQVREEELQSEVVRLRLLCHQLQVRGDRGGRQEGQGVQKGGGEGGSAGGSEGVG